MTRGSGSGVTKVMVKSMVQRRSNRHWQPGLWLTVVARPMLRAFGVSLHPGGAGSVDTTKQLPHFFVFTKKDARI